MVESSAALLDAPLPPENRLTQPLAKALSPLASSDWWPLLQRWQQSPEGRELMARVDARVGAQLGSQMNAQVLADTVPVYPAAVFKALQLTPRLAVRVLILGQDPYHGPGQAEGLAFSVANGLRWPPSLRNIFKELQRDLGLPLPAPDRGSLAHWAAQGVLLLNTSLTVEAGSPGSHARLGWHVLTDAIIQDLWVGARPMVFMLWGVSAQQRWQDVVKKQPGATAGHLVLHSNHPSPLSALRPPEPFIGSGHFGRASRWLQEQGLPGIDWSPGDAGAAGGPAVIAPLPAAN